MNLTEASTKLSRNPLGIIALFIVLVYGIAALVFGVSAGALDPNLKMPLVYFLVGFPVLVLGVFSWLVSKHHTKLYAPADFRDDDSFLRTIGMNEQLLRLEKEIDSMTSDSIEETDIETGPSVIPEKVQRVRRSELRTSIILAEDLVFRDLELDFDALVRRHVVVNSRRGPIELDGVILRRSGVIGVEVKFFRKSFGRSVRDSLTSLAVKMGDTPMIFALVADGMSSSERDNVVRRLEKHLPDGSVVDVRVYDFAELRQRFGIDTE